MDLITLSIADFLAISDSDFTSLPVLVEGPKPPSVYQVLATLMAQAWYSLLVAAAAVQLPPETIVALQQAGPEMDLLGMYFTTGNIIKRQAINLTRFQSVAITLNNWALADSGATNIDTMLTEQEITVPQGWADICAFVGVRISDANIAG